MTRLPTWTLILIPLALIGPFLGAIETSRSDSGAILSGARTAIDARLYPSLQAALDALPSEGGLVRIPPGLFEIARPLVIQSADVCVVGAGTATHIVNVNTSGQPAILVRHPSGAKDRQQELWRIRLTNLRLTGNPKSGHGIHALRINELMLDAVTISEHGGDGVHLDFCYEDPRICNCLITYNKGTGLHLNGCHDIVVSANQFEENGDALQCLDSFNLTMTGNNLDDHLGRGVVIENTYGSVVASNMIEECQAAAIVLDRDCYGITLSANVIAHNGAGIDLRDAHGCAVSANTFTLMGADALRIGPASDRIAVAGNSFCNSYIGQGQVRRGADDLAAAGMVLEGTRDIGVTGNVFSSVRPKAFAVAGDTVRNVLFAGNVMCDTTSDHGLLKDSVVCGNLDSSTVPAGK